MSFNRDDLIAFLVELDHEMSSRAELVVIGGASLTLAYNFSNTTIDMDLITRITAELQEAIEKAKSKINLDIKVSTTSVYATIREMDHRLEIFEDVSFKNLTIYIPEKHDLALMKCARSEARDIVDIQGLHHSSPLNCEILLDRFKHSLLPLNPGDDYTLKMKFLDMIETLFGEDIADDFELKI